MFCEESHLRCLIDSVSCCRFSIFSETVSTYVLLTTLAPFETSGLVVVVVARNIRDPLSFPKLLFIAITSFMLGNQVMMHHVSAPDKHVLDAGQIICVLRPAEACQMRILSASLGDQHRLELSPSSKRATHAETCRNLACRFSRFSAESPLTLAQRTSAETSNLHACRMLLAMA